MYTSTILLLMLNYSYVLSKDSIRIHRGSDAKEGTFEYIIKLGRLIYTTDGKRHSQLEKQVCTGGVISQNWSVTAAHCLPEDIEIKMTKTFQNITINITVTTTLIYDSKDGIPERGKILKAIKPYSYSKTISIQNNDIGLLKTEPIYLFVYGWVSPLDISSLLGEEVTLTGYGGVNRTNNHLTKVMTLQVLKGSVVTCGGFVKMSNLCVVRKCGDLAMVCRGDSGGPVIHQSGIIGVISLSTTADCYKLNKNNGIAIMTAFKPISNYIDWIVDVMKNN